MPPLDTVGPVKRRRRGWAFRKTNESWFFGIQKENVYNWDEKTGVRLRLGFGPYHLTYHTQEKEK